MSWIFPLLGGLSSYRLLAGSVTPSASDLGFALGNSLAVQTSAPASRNASSNAGGIAYH